MATCSPTRVLRDEHQLILRVINALDAILNEPPERAADPVRDCVSFFRLFTDACHHGKEEDLLFDALADHGFPRQAGPVAVMLQEHEMGRSLVRRMADGLERHGEGETEAWPDVLLAGRSYVSLLRDHINKEDNVLFDMADRTVPDGQCRRLCDAYDAVCARRFEGRSLQELEELAASIVEKA